MISNCYFIKHISNNSEKLILTPTSSHRKNRKRKKRRAKCYFIDDEANVSGGGGGGSDVHSDDEENDSFKSQFVVASNLICDNVIRNDLNIDMEAKYLQSVRFVKTENSYSKNYIFIYISLYIYYMIEVH